MSQPIQPIYTDHNGMAFFKSNAIVRFLLDAGPFDMNHLAIREFSVEDREQFAQLIGYSLSGFSELSYVRDETYEAAFKMYMYAGDRDETEVRNQHLREDLTAIRDCIRGPVARLFGIDPDDLKGSK